MMRRGDTIVEVLLSTVILSIVLAGAFSLSNKAIQTGQLSIERTEAVNIVRDHAESLRFIHSTDVVGYDEVWTEILSNADGDSPQYTGDNFCKESDAVNNPIYLDFGLLGTDFSDPANDPADMVQAFDIPESGGRLQYADATDNESNDLFAVWIEVYDPDPSTVGIVDIHIRACWEAPGSGNPQRVGSVVRLSETRDT